MKTRKEDKNSFSWFIQTLKVSKQWIIYILQEKYLLGNKRKKDKSKKKKLKKKSSNHNAICFV